MLQSTLLKNSVGFELPLPERGREHYVTLPGSMASYGLHTQTRTFKIQANLLAYLTNLPLYML